MAPTYIGKASSKGTYLIFILGEMKRIHQKSQNTEKRKIQFFGKILTEFVDVVGGNDLINYYQQSR